MEWLGLVLNIAGICSAITGPVALSRGHKKIAIIAALMALGYTTVTIVGLILEWHHHYSDLNSDLAFFGSLAALTAFSGARILVVVRYK